MVFERTCDPSLVVVMCAPLVPGTGEPSPEPKEEPKPEPNVDTYLGEGKGWSAG